MFITYVAFTCQNQYCVLTTWLLGLFEKEEFWKHFTLRLEFCIDDEKKTSQAKSQDNQRIFRVSANNLKYTCMTKVKILRLFISFSIFFSIFSSFEFFRSSLYQCKMLWIMFFFQIFSVFHWFVEVLQCRIVYFFSTIVF